MNRTQISLSVSLTSALIAFSFFGVKAVPQSSPLKPRLPNFTNNVTDAPADVVGARRHLAAEPSSSVRLVARRSIDENKFGITIFITNSAVIAPADLLKSEEQTARIFRESGIGVSWIDCAPGSMRQICRNSVAPNQFVVHVVPRGRTSVDDVLGISFLGPDGTGAYSDAFYDRIQTMHRKSGVDGALLLGTVMAHEIGHLLLGLNAHSLMGIMSAHWSREELRLIGMGCMGFTADQSSRMRARIVRARSHDSAVS